MLDCEAEELAEEFWNVHAQMMRAGEDLVGMIPEGIDSPTYVAISPSIQRVVDFMNKQRDDLNTPVNELRYGQFSHGELRRVRRAGLIAGIAEIAGHDAAAA